MRVVDPKVVERGAEDEDEGAEVTGISAGWRVGKREGVKWYRSRIAE
tara:strand:- start:167 stop:307 length:141 start_codon:yes stop_codon:yes gene_type:complete